MICMVKTVVKPCATLPSSLYQVAPMEDPTGGPTCKTGPTCAELPLSVNPATLEKLAYVKIVVRVGAGAAAPSAILAACFAAPACATGTSALRENAATTKPRTYPERDGPKMQRRIPLSP